MINKEKKDKLFQWGEAGRKKEFTSMEKKEANALKVFQDSASNGDWNFDESKLDKDELLLFYYNNMDVNNAFASITNFSNLDSLKWANYLVNSENFEELIELLSKNSHDQFMTLFKYAKKRMEQGIGQNISTKQLKSLLDAEDYDGLKEVLSNLCQKPLSYDNIEYFVASEIDLNYFLEQHKKDLGKNIIQFLMQGKSGINCFEYSKFREHIWRSEVTREGWKKCEAKKYNNTITSTNSVVTAGGTI